MIALRPSVFRGFAPSFPNAKTFPCARFLAGTVFTCTERASIQNNGNSLREKVRPSFRTSILANNSRAGTAEICPSAPRVKRGPRFSAPTFAADGKVLATHSGSLETKTRPVAGFIAVWTEKTRVQAASSSDGIQQSARAFQHTWISVWPKSLFPILDSLSPGYVSAASFISSMMCRPAVDSHLMPLPRAGRRGCMFKLVEQNPAQLRLRGFTS